MAKTRGIDSTLLDPARPSGRGEWWDVAAGTTRLWRDAPNCALTYVHLDVYVVARAEAGCADCISAILECPNDASLLAALAYNARKISVDMLVEDLKIGATSR